MALICFNTSSKKIAFLLKIRIEFL